MLKIKNNMPKKIISIGSSTQDIFLVSEKFKVIKSKLFKTGYAECLPYGAKIELENICSDTGGAATNTAFTFANLGLKTGIISKVGTDLAGENIKLVLKKKGIDIRGLKIIKNGRTAYSTILLVSGGDRTILVFRGVCKEFLEKDIDSTKINSEWVYLSSLGGSLKAYEKVIKIAKNKKIKIATNPGSEELNNGLNYFKRFKGVDIFNINREEAIHLVKESSSASIKTLFSKLSKLNNKINIITDGIRGAYASYENKIYFAPSLGTVPVNTTGAGDAFGAGFVAGFIEKNDIEYALKVAVINSDGVIREMGAKNGLVNKTKLKKEINKAKVQIL